MYDQDSSGEITPDEMVDIFSLMYAVQVGRFSSQQIKLNWSKNICVVILIGQGCTEGDGKAQAKKVFAALDIDKDGKIGLEEFITVGQTMSMNITSRCQQHLRRQNSLDICPI